MKGPARGRRTLSASVVKLKGVPMAAKTWVVADDLWERIEPLLPKVERRFRIGPTLQLCVSRRRSNSAGVATKVATNACSLPWKTVVARVSALGRSYLFQSQLFVPGFPCLLGI